MVRKCTPYLSIKVLKGVRATEIRTIPDFPKLLNNSFCHARYNLCDEPRSRKRSAEVLCGALLGFKFIALEELNSVGVGRVVNVLTMNRAGPNPILERFSLRGSLVRIEARAAFARGPNVGCNAYIRKIAGITRA